MQSEEEVRAMRDRSGRVDIDSRLVSFLYELMRDHLTPGQVEEIAKNSQESKVEYTNGWLARYAADLATRLGYPPARTEELGSPPTSTPP